MKVRFLLDSHLFFYPPISYYVIQSGTKCSEGSRGTYSNVNTYGCFEILPPFGRLDNIMGITTDKIKVTLWL